MIRRSMENFHHFSRETGLSLPQMSVLMHLRHHGPCEVTTLATRMQFSKPAASQMIERLVQQGLVERIEVSGDRRARLIQVTPKGQQITEASIQSGQSWLQELTASFTVQQKEEISQVLSLLVETAERPHPNIERSY